METQSAPQTTPTGQAVNPDPQPTKPLVMNDTEAAPILDVSVHTLRKMRSQGVGPAYCKVGKCVRYRLSDLEAYIQKQTVTR